MRSGALDYELMDAEILMKSRVFWISFMLLGLCADVILPLMWGLLATIPVLFFSWWLAYRSDWFE